MLTVWLARPADTPAVVGVVTGVIVARAAEIPAEDAELVDGHDADEAHGEEEAHDAGQAVEDDPLSQPYAPPYWARAPAKKVAKATDCNIARSSKIDQGELYSART